MQFSQKLVMFILDSDEKVNKTLKNFLCLMDEDNKINKSILKLSQELGISRNTLAYRMEPLLENDIIRKAEKVIMVNPKMVYSNDREANIRREYLYKWIILPKEEYERNMKTLKDLIKQRMK